MVLATAVHFEIGLGPVSCEDRPFMFRVANLKFALKLWLLLSLLWLVGGSCDVGVFLFG